MEPSLLGSFQVVRAVSCNCLQSKPIGLAGWRIPFRQMFISASKAFVQANAMPLTIATSEGTWTLDSAYTYEGQSEQSIVPNVES
jgi:hypothetical protein